MPSISSIYLNIKVSERNRASWGCNKDYFVEVSVESDGVVRVLDPVSETYTWHHDLTEEEIAVALEMAAKVRQGTHYTSGGFLFKKAS